MRGFPSTALSAAYRRLVKRQQWQGAHRRVFAPSIRPADVFLVTYPKSGTTWLGYLLANILKPVHDPQAALRVRLRQVPDINTLYNAAASLHEHASLPDPRLFRVHAPYDPAFPRVVYVLRDPRAVMVSFWHYKRLTQPAFARSLKEFVARDNHWPGRWDQHVAGWLYRHCHPRLLVVRYEEMHADPAAALKRVLDFAGLPYRAGDIERAVSASRFDEMRSLEERVGIDTFAGSREERFVRRGQIDAWRDELDAEDVRILEERYRPIMRKAGYALTG